MLYNIIRPIVLVKFINSCTKTETVIKICFICSAETSNPVVRFHNLGNILRALYTKVQNCYKVQNVPLQKGNDTFELLS